MKEWLKHAVLRTPFEGAIKRGRNFLDACALIRHPERYELWREEPRVGRLLAMCLKPASNCVDVGAHLGSMLSQFVRRAPEGSHLAFEPNPEHVRWLKAKFPEVDVRQEAVSDGIGEIEFFVNETLSGFSGLRPIEITGQSGPSFRSFQVPMTTLDSAVPPGHRVDFLKTIVEGAELSVLRGAEEILRRDRPIILIECVEQIMALHGVTPSDVFEFLTGRHDYSLYLLKDYLNREPQLDFRRFQAAIRFPFQAIKFVAAPNPGR